MGAEGEPPMLAPNGEQPAGPFLSGVFPGEGPPPPSPTPDIKNPIRTSLNRPASPPDDPQVESPQPRTPPSAALFCAFRTEEEESPRSGCVVFQVCAPKN